MATRFKSGRILSFLAGVVVTVCILNMIFLPSEHLNYTVQVSLIPMVAAVVIFFSGSILRRSYDVIRVLVCCVLTVIFMLMLSIKELHLGFPFSDIRYQCLYILILTFSCFTVIDELLYRFLQPINRENASDLGSGSQYTDITAAQKKEFYRWVTRFMIVYGVMVAIHVLANFPFRSSSDAIRVYRQIQLGEWGDHHPIGYILFFKLCMDLFSFVAWHPFSVNVVQTLLWLIIFVRICWIIFVCTSDMRAVRLWCYGNIVIFIPLMYLGCAIKDTPYAFCLLGICAELYRLLLKRTMSRADLVILTLYFIGTALFRHAGVASSLIPVICAAVYIRDKRIIKKLVISVAVTAAVFFVTVYGIGFGILKMYANPPYMKYTVPLYIVANLLNSREELFDEEDIEVCEEFLPVEDWKRAYESNPYLADTIARGSDIVGDRIDLVDDDYGKEILKLNLKLLLRSPIDYLKAISKITSIIWQIARPADAYEQCAAGYWLPEDKPELIEEGLITDRSWIADTLGRFQYFFHDEPVLSFIYYRGGIWLYGCIFAMAVFLLKRCYGLMICAMPPLVMSALMMLSCPEQDARYVFPVLLSGLFLLPAARFITCRTGK